MTPIRTQFKTLTRAAVVALALGATALTAAPAMAQDGPATSFSIQVPGGGGGAQQAPTFEGEMGTQRHGGWDDDYGYGYRCLTNREVRRGIAAYGYQRVQVVREFRRDRVEVQAIYGNWLYSMHVDKCTGYVDRVQRIRRAYGGGFDGGFGFEFNFGN